MTGYGNFVWYELHADDNNQAKAFYESVLGWKVEESGQPGMDYRFITIDGVRIGGMMRLPDNPCEANSRPSWLGYIGVEDADACARKVQEKGGFVHRAPTDIPGYGRFAVLADPQGSVFAVIAPAEHWRDSPSQVFRPSVPGFGGWHELYANDQESAFDFYASLFGWSRHDAVDLGEMGVYQLFAIDGVRSGGMMNRCPQTPAPCWNYYFNVESVEAAAGRVREAGGQVLMGPHQVPGGEWIVTARDSQGAVFALVSAKQ